MMMMETWCEIKIQQLNLETKKNHVEIVINEFTLDNYSQFYSMIFLKRFFLTLNELNLVEISADKLTNCFPRLN